MYIKYCPIPFHDIEEIVEFLSSLSVAMSTVFDGCVIDGLPVLFYYQFSPDLKNRWLFYKIIRE